MIFFKRFILMMQFMTSIPINIAVKAEKEDFGKALTAASFVGSVIGVFLAAGYYVFSLLFPPNIAAVFTLAIYILLTGGIHIDGLGDTADGLFSNRQKEKILEIMKDSRVGTNAVLAVLLVVLLDISLISALGSGTVFVLLLMPVAGRVGSLVASGASKYAGISDGPGRWCVECCGKKEIIKGLINYVFIFLVYTVCFNICRFSQGIIDIPAVITAGIIPPFSAFFMARILGKRLGGVTGDILGAVCELNQVIFLLVVFILSKFI
jgi:adenosylcobinamide-GDP ribazoletransferase